MNHDIEKNLIACLDNMEQGETVDAILARYPHEAAELRPYLETAAHLPQLASLPSIAAQKQSQAGFLAGAAALRSPQAAPTPIWLTLRQLLMPLASLAVILLLLGFALLTTSAAALPGDALYPVKLGLEEFRLRRAADPQQSQSLAEQFQQERVREIEALLRAGRQADVLFEGQIESIAAVEWIIADLPLQIAAETIIEGKARIGELARVNGHVENGVFFARQIILLTSSTDPDEPPLPAVLPTNEASTTPLPSATPLSTPLPTTTAESQPMSTPSQGDAPAIQPPATATAVDEPESSPPTNENGDENDNSGDDENDNGGDDENDNSGDDENDNSGDDENDNSSDDENDNSGDDENDNSGDDESDNSGDDENDNSSDDENDNSGDDENDNSGDDESDNSGDGNDNDDDENDNDNDDDESSGDDDDDDGESNDDDQESSARSQLLS